MHAWFVRGEAALDSIQRGDVGGMYEGAESGWRFDVVFICPSINLCWRLRWGGVGRAGGDEEEDEEEEDEETGKSRAGVKHGNDKARDIPSIADSLGGILAGRMQRPYF